MPEIEQLLGSIPDWLSLGPEIELNGQLAREVLGDWSHRAECDRPPRYLVDAPYLRTLPEVDRSATRIPVKVTKLGRPIEELKGKHSGKCAIFFNGPSLGDHNLSQVKCPIIGMNRTFEGFKGYKGPQPDYLCLVDYLWFQPPFREHVLKHPCVVNGSNHPDSIGWRVARSARMRPFSFDLARDGYVGPVPCTTGHLSLQLAVYLGFTELNCFGWDLQGKHFDKTESSRHLKDAMRYHERQKELLDRQGIKVYGVGSPEGALFNVFPQRSFEEFLNG